MTTAYLSVISYALVVLLTATRAWRAGRTSRLEWRGPARVGWLVFRRVSRCVADATLAGAGWVFGLVLVGVTASEYTALSFSPPAWGLAAICAAMTLYFLERELDGAAGGRVFPFVPTRATVAGASEGNASDGCGAACYSARARIAFPRKRLLLGGMSACVAFIPAFDLLPMWQAAPWVWWWAAGALAMPCLSTFASTATRACLRRDQLVGHTVWGIRRFTADIGELRAARARDWRREEVLVVTRLGGWPIVFSSQGTGYEQLLQHIYPRPETGTEA